MPISKIKSSSITADAASTNLNIDANTLFLDATNNRVGVGTTSPQAKLDVQGDVISTSYVRIGNPGELSVALGKNVSLVGSGSSNDGTLFMGSGLALRIYTSELERMRIDSAGNVNIGTTGIAEKLVVNGAILSRSGQSALFSNTTSIDYNAANLGRFIVTGPDSSTYPAIVFANTTTTTYAERMRIDSSGNVGIGKSSPAATLDIVGPSAGASPYLSKSIQFAPSNFPDRTWSLNYDDSGSAGNGFNISSQSTKILYLNGTGKVGIGTVSPVAQLDIENSSARPFGTAAQLNAVFKGSVSIGEGGAIGFDYFGNHTNAPTSMGYAIESQAGSTKGSLVFGARSVTTDTAPTERMRINSDGKMMIGQTSPTNGAGITLQPNLATSQVGINGNFRTVWNIPTGTCGLFTVHLGGNGQYGGAALFFVTFGQYSPGGNATVTLLSAAQGDQSGYNWSWQVASNGQFQMRNNTNTVDFTPVINLITLG